MHKKKNRRVLTVATCLMIAAAALVEARAESALNENEGFVLLAYNLTGRNFKSLTLAKAGQSRPVHKIESYESGTNYEVIRLPAGEYHWQRLATSFKFKWDLDDLDLSFTVEPGKINYGGHFFGSWDAKMLYDWKGKWSRSSRTNFLVRNRSTQAISHLVRCCRELTSNLDFSYTGEIDDAFGSILLTAFDGKNSLYSDFRFANLEKDYETDYDVETLTERVIHDLFRRRHITTPQISPNGQRVGFFEIRKGKRFLMIVDLDLRKKFAAVDWLETRRLGGTFGNFYWVGNSHIIYEIAVDGGTTLGLASLGWIEKEYLSTVRSSWYPNSVLVDPLPTEEHHAIIGTIVKGTPGVFKIDVSKDKATHKLRARKSLVKDLKGSSGWILDHNGVVRTALGYDEQTSEQILWYRENKRADWRIIWRGSEFVRLEPVMVSLDDRYLFLLTDENSSYRELFRYDISTEQLLESVFAIDGEDIYSVQLSPSKDRIISVGYFVNGVFTKEIIDVEKLFNLRSLKEKFPDESPHVVDMSNDGNRLVISTAGSSDPGAFYVLDVSRWITTRFGTVAPWLTDITLGRLKKLKATSTDGREVESYLTLPGFDTDGKPPLIVMPHGGPISYRSTDYFSPYVQSLAALGYAVLQPNYRDWSDFNEQMYEVAPGQWGRLVQDDIEAAVYAAVESGAVDGDKVCIYGIGYGGYSALFSAIRRPHLYKCVASYGGITDLNLLFDDASRSMSGESWFYLSQIFGDPDTDEESLLLFSPAYNAEHVGLPVFLAHGSSDNVVDFEHFLRFYQMMRIENKAVDGFVIPGEDNRFRGLSGAIEFHSELDAFFREHLDLPAPSQLVIRRAENSPD